MSAQLVDLTIGNLRSIGEIAAKMSLTILYKQTEAQADAVMAQAKAAMQRTLAAIVPTVAINNEPGKIVEPKPVKTSEPVSAAVETIQETLKTSALAAINLNLSVFPLIEQSKDPDGRPGMAPHGFKSSSKDPNQVREWWTKSPDANIGIDCGASDLCVFDFDRKESIPAWVENFKTLKIQTAKGIHVYTRGARPSKRMYDETGKHIGEIKSIGGYVIWDKSVHPSGAIYQIVDDSPIAPVPDDRLAELIKSAPGEIKIDVSPNGAKIPYGSHDNELTRIAGKLRNDGMEEDSIYGAIVEVCEKRCEGYGSDYKEMCRKIAHSVHRYPVGPNTDLVLTNVPAQIAQTGATDDEPEIEDCQIAKRPEFPRWVMAGTSLDEGLVKPATQYSSKYPELIFIPAVQMYLNALALHVKLKNMSRTVLNMFVGVIAPYGQYFKSTCCELGHEYFHLLGFAQRHTRDLKSADNKIIITSVGSTEGLGKMMQGLNGKKAVLYFDELGKVAGKVGIENSSFGEDLLSFYESNEFGNVVKDNKSCFSFPAKEYCFGWQWCTTDRAFPRHWAKLANISSGLNDRMFFLLAPEKPKEAEMYIEPVLAPGAIKTRQLIDKAIQQGVYEYEDYEQANKIFKGMDARGLAAAERLALYFAVDLGLTIIDEECCERARALADYRHEVLVYLDPVEAETLQGKIQQEITRELRRNGGKMPYRKLHHELHGERLGSGVWENAFNGIVGNGTIAVRAAKPGKGAAQRPKMVYLLKQEEY